MWGLWADDRMLKSVGVVICHGKCICKELTADPCLHAGSKFCRCVMCFLLDYCSLHPDVIPVAHS